jgi:nitrogen fixation/metabolism regulation signal transduction histidine kinase
VESFNSMTAQLGESRRAREEALAELEQRRQWIETLLESIPTGVLTLSTDQRLIRINDAAKELLGCPTAQQTPLEDLLPREAAQACTGLFNIANRGGMVAAQIDFPLRDRIAHVAVTVAALRRDGQNQGYVLVLDDLSDLLKAQKATAWQEVAQRIAHEIKNPLTPIQLSADRIRNYAQKLADENSPERTRIHELILQCAGTVQEEVSGLKDLVDEFSRFARFPVVKPMPTRLNDLVESALSLYPDPASGITVHTELAEKLPLVTADAALLRRVVTNLVQNASESLSETDTDIFGPREIRIRTRYLEEAHCVELTVADSGSGILPENKEGLFLPFFSTKATGMGLGLAIVSRIISEHQGTIRVEDNQPRGTRFIIELPAEPRPVAA